MPQPAAAGLSPRVTVIIPTYNWSSVLPYSIGSVLRQSFTDFELLVVGDGCTDDSEQVVRAIGDPRLRWINLAVNDGHQSAPNNEGLRQARGSIIAYLGHDDLWLPHHLEVMIAAIDGGADVVYSIVHMIGPEGKILPPAGEGRRFRPGEWLPPTGVMHRRNAVERAGFWRNYREISLDPETDLWLRMHKAGCKFQGVPRLTAVKFPALYRKDSYKKRACDEQREWTERILHEKDMEAVELGKLLIAKRRKRTFGEGVRAALGRISSEARRRVPLGGGAMIRWRRKYKGLENRKRAK
ncbi:MAG TPA: glycosyltransferase [Bryobacteraceae bacterium]|nr:glycosyltransferase [Bryobacteraceae bacterium]